jgi:hypothetical protein
VGGVEVADLVGLDGEDVGMGFKVVGLGRG